MTQQPYDPETYVHWLYWKIQCLEAPPEAFERLFQSVAERAKARFVRVKPYGKFGDRKVDGLFWDDGTAYQVYSPDEMREAETRKKIEEDLAGAVAHWGQALRRWVFVYNVRRGLAPDVVSLLQRERARYPNLTIEPLSNHDLWAITRSLTPQERVEVLGPPPGYEDLFPLNKVLPETIQKHLKTGRFVVVHDILSPINVRDALKAIHPSKPFGPPLLIRPAVAGEWQLAAEYQKTIVDEAIAQSRDRLPRFAVFSLAPIPLAIHLGYLLSDRVEVEPFQYDRDRKTWLWPDQQSDIQQEFEIAGLPTETVEDPADVVVRVSLSAHIPADDTRAVTGRLPVEVDLRVPNPDVMWLVSPEQLRSLGAAVRNILGKIRLHVPKCTRIHLFYAGPTGGAIVIGQALNPRMNPPTVLYEFHRQRQPRYEVALTLDD